MHIVTSLALVLPLTLCAMQRRPAARLSDRMAALTHHLLAHPAPP